MSRSIVTTKINSKYSSGGGGSGTVSTVGTIDTATKSANGLVITGSQIFAQTANATYPGLVSTGDQTFNGTKTFNTSFITTANYQSFNGVIVTSTIDNSAGYAGIKKAWLNFGSSLYLWDTYKNLSSTNPNIILGNNTTGNTSSTSSGADNIIIGNDASANLSTGASNVIIGTGAGGTITTGGNNVLLGASANLNNSTNTNSIVIGFGANGLGNNTVVLGADTISKTYLKGALNVNTSYYTADQALATDTNKNIISVAKVDLVPTMVGSNGSTVGTKGLVPAPAATDNVKYLKGDGTWSTVTYTGTGPIATTEVTSSDLSGTIKYENKKITLKNTGTYSSGATVYFTRDGSNNLGSSTAAIPSSEWISGSNVIVYYQATVTIRVTAVTGTVTTSPTATAVNNFAIYDKVGFTYYSADGGVNFNGSSVGTSVTINSGVSGAILASNAAFNLAINAGQVVTPYVTLSSWTGGGTVTIKCVMEANFYISYF